MQGSFPSHPSSQSWHLNWLSSLPEPILLTLSCPQPPAPSLLELFEQKLGQERPRHIPNGWAPRGMGAQPETKSSSLGKLQ